MGFSVINFSLYLYLHHQTNKVTFFTSVLIGYWEMNTFPVSWLIMNRPLKININKCLSVCAIYLYLKKKSKKTKTLFFLLFSLNMMRQPPLFQFDPQVSKILFFSTFQILSGSQNNLIFLFPCFDFLLIGFFASPLLRWTTLPLNQKKTKKSGMR